MKKNSLAIFLFTLCVCVTARAQENQAAQAATQQVPRNAVVYHHEISAGYGLISTNDVLGVMISSVLTISGGYTEDNGRMTGSFMAAYKYRFNRVASLGATYAYGAQSADVYTEGSRWGSMHSGFHTLAIECDFRYLTRKIVTLYSTLGVGATLYNYSLVSLDGENEIASVIHPNYQLSLIGVKLGTYRAGGLIEFGFGYKGIVNIGAYVRF